MTNELTLASLLARIEAIEAQLAAKPATKATTTPRKAGEMVTFEAVCPIKGNGVEARVYTSLLGRTLSRADAIAHIEAGKYSTRPANIMLYDVMVKASKAAPVAPVAPVVVAPVAPIVEMPVDTTPAVTSETQAPIVELVVEAPAAAPAAPKATRTRKAATK